MLLAVGKQLLHRLVVGGQCHQLVHASLDVVAAHQFVQLFARVVDRRQNFYLHAQVCVLINHSAGNGLWFWFWFVGLVQFFFLLFLRHLFHIQTAVAKPLKSFFKLHVHIAHWFHPKVNALIHDGVEINLST